MKKALSVLLSAGLILIFALPSFASEEISAKSAVVICADSLEVVYSKNMNERLPMASTTKIMTSLLALERGASEELVTVKSDMIAVEGSSIGLKDGDRVSLNTLVKGMLLESGNDAANAVAVIVGGDVPAFVGLMNEKAKQIGMMSTSFETPSGLDGDNHYSTAYDMALLGAYSLKNPQFRNICSSKSEAVYYGNPPFRRMFTNHNKLLSYYDGVFGIKTGYTKKSGRCLVSAAEKDGKTLVAVTLNAPDDWSDHKKMYDDAFPKVTSLSLTANLSDKRLKIVGGCKASIAVKANALSYTSLSQSFKYTSKILIKPFEYAPVYKGDIVGSLEFFDAKGQNIGSIPITAAETVQYSSNEDTEKLNEGKKTLFDKIKDFFRI